MAHEKVQIAAFVSRHCLSFHKFIICMVEHGVDEMGGGKEGGSFVFFLYTRF